MIVKMKRVIPFFLLTFAVLIAGCSKGKLKLETLAAGKLVDDIELSVLGDRIKNKEDLVVIRGDSLCGGCQMTKPYLIDFVEEYKVEFIYLEDNYSNDDVATVIPSLKGKLTPAFAFIKSGKVIKVEGDKVLNSLEAVENYIFKFVDIV